MTHADHFGLVGQVLQRKYRVDACIGEGGFAVVYRGEHLTFQSSIAIKCLKIPPHFTPAAQTLFLDRFREEGKHLFKLAAHSAVVKVHDLDVTERGVPYMVLEWLEGRELADELADRRRRGLPPYTETEALALLRPAIEALSVAHALGVAHRDIKPQNLYLANTVAGRSIKVLDFGVAKAMQDGETATQLVTRTTSGFAAFSPNYGAPEQFASKKYGATGPWTDVHAMGLVLTELVTGQAAYEGEELADWMTAGLGSERPTPRARGGRVSDAFEHLVARAVARASKERFASAAELLAAVDAFSQPLGVAGTAPPDLSRQIPPRPEGTVRAFPAPSLLAAQRLVGVGAMAPEPAPAWVGGTTRTGGPTQMASAATIPEPPRGAQRVKKQPSTGVILGASLGVLGVVAVVALWPRDGSKKMEESTTDEPTPMALSSAEVPKSIVALSPGEGEKSMVLGSTSVSGAQPAAPTALQSPPGEEALASPASSPSDPCAKYPSAANYYACGGNNGFAGAAGVLYVCADGATKSTRKCTAGCFFAPEGVPDRCVEDSSPSPAAASPSDPCALDPATKNAPNYYVCGGNQGFTGAPGVLYVCSGGVTKSTRKCADGCFFAPHGVPDCCVEDK